MSFEFAAADSYSKKLEVVVSIVLYVYFERILYPPHSVKSTFCTLYIQDPLGLRKFVQNFGHRSGGSSMILHED